MLSLTVWVICQLQCFTFRIKFTIRLYECASVALHTTPMIKLKNSLTHTAISRMHERGPVQPSVGSSAMDGFNRLWFKESIRLLRLKRREEIFVRKRAANSHIEQQDMPCDASSTVSPGKRVLLKSFKLPTTCKEISLVLLWGTLNFRGQLVFA